MRIEAEDDMDSGKMTEFLIGVMILIATCLFVGYLRFKKRYIYWKNRRIPFPNPNLIFGNFKDMFLSKATEAEVINEICEKFENEKFVGLYYLWTPVLLIKDMDLVKNVTERDFQFFSDHPEITGDSEVDSVSNSLFTMKGSVWKERRLYFTKLFSPKKIKEYFLNIEAGLNILLKNVEECAKDGKDVESIKLVEKYTVHAIASSMYGLDLTKDERNTSKFAAIANLLIHPPPMSIIKITLHTILPGLCNALRISSHPSEIWDYISEFAANIFKAREDSDYERVDLVSMLMKLMADGSTNIKKIDYKEAIGHFFSFFQAGHHTTEISLSHVLLRLSQHKQVQDNLRKEIISAMDDSGALSYESLTKLHYLHGVISETLRMKPALGLIKRICTKPYKLSEDLEVAKGTVIYIPIEYLQNHPQFFPDPQEFNPERFYPGNADQSAYMSFGRGPRLCIGMRFAELEMKRAIAAIISEYEILPSEKMKFPITFDPKTLFFTNIPIGGIWIKFRPLKSGKSI